MEYFIKIKKRDRDFGIFSWQRKDDFDIMTLFGKEELIQIVIEENTFIKKVSYKYRRFSLGKAIMNRNPDKNHFSIKKENNRISLYFVNNQL